MVGRAVSPPMAFEYTSLKILQLLERSKRSMPLEDLRGALAQAGFRFEGGRLEENLDRLRQRGLVDTLVLAGGESAIPGVSITPAGERKVRGIVRF